MAKKGKGKVEPSPPPVDTKKGKKKGKQEEPSQEDETKKPQRGMVIGENFGWTGKLPATLLFEYAQKQKWEKVVVDMRKKGKGFVGVINLSWKNPKTQEMIRVQMIPDQDLYQPKETTNEARHYAATYALHRINFAKNMKTVLPVVFRDYWSDLEAKRSSILKESKEKHDYYYNSQPFQVFLEKRERDLKKEKEREIRAQNEEKVRKPTINITTINSKKPSTSSTNSKITKPSKPSTTSFKIMKKIPSFPNKVWQNAPFFDFTSEVRTKIEASIRNHLNWTIASSNTIVTQSSSEDYLRALTNLGFREIHIKESFKYTSTFTDALEWLLFHIPEDDLPPYFMKSDKDSGVSLKISKDIKMENLLKRVAQSGADEDELLTALQDCDFDEIKTSVKLTHDVVNYVQPTEENTFETDEECLELWKQELEGIEMLNADNTVEFFEGSSGNIATISLAPHTLQKGLLSVKVFRSENYPNNIPGIQIVVNNTSFRMANYIKLSILRQLLHHIIESGYVGSCYIFSIIEWLEENISKIINNPGPLFIEENYNGEGRSVEEVESQKKLKNSKSRTHQKLNLSPSDIERLRSEYAKKQQSREMISSINRRKQLPAWKKAEQLVSIINSNKVTIVTGETGSGKSTQIVQFILDDLNSRGNFSGKIMCTQPRRISTIGLAERISEERCDSLGKETGYLIRGENKTSANTRISFVTTGVLLRMIQGVLSTKKGDQKNNIFDNLEYIFIDEVHERSVDSDFLLIILRNIMQGFPKLKVILMSATIDINTFKNFFKTPLNHIHIEGRTFPIEDYYLDTVLEELDYTIETYDGEKLKPKADSQFFKSGNINYELIAQLCGHVDRKLSNESNDGSILIFLPGIMEINKCIRAIEKQNGSKFWCLPLHSALSSADQKRVFKNPPAGSRKIVVSTNVAETSITIPDCVVVIDSGRSKSMFFDSNINSTKLIENWCSKAEIGQRRGRSGRITNGNCYHMYSRDTVAEMLDQPIPEIKRTRLENLFLVVKSMGIDKVEAFLNSGLDPPDQSSLAKSKQFLIDIGALEESEAVSNLGRYLSLLPTDLQSGKLLILGCIFGCLETCLTIAAISTTGSPFRGSFEERDKIKQIQSSFANNQGDVIAMVRAFDAYTKVKSESGQAQQKKFLNDNYLSFLTLKEIATTKNQYVSILQDIGFVPLKYRADDLKLNKNNENYSIIRAIITGSFYPQLARVQLPNPKFLKSSVGSVAVDPDAKETKFWIRNETYVNNLNNDVEDPDVLPASRAFIHPSSVLFSNSNASLDSIPNIEEFTNEDGTIDFAKAQQVYKVDFTPSAPGSSNSMIKSSFVMYNASHHTSKLYLRDITSTSTLAVLLFGGQIAYDLSSGLSSGKTSPGIVLDSVWPIRTWCKNGVLLKRLRHLLDGVIEERLSSPYYVDGEKKRSSDDILSIVEKILHL
ncbi:putative ATP-dependent RNA helicase YLR419W [[Candida] anglica]|uniref:ATP-dependent RNA helicase YLR419W n=1 Tax=[Candida] anglica TaxID=148631 RepID=A0ABP0ER23_9ASCO